MFQYDLEKKKSRLIDESPIGDFSDLAWYEFALPPLEEQRRIVGVLTAARVQADSLSELVTVNRRVYSSAAVEFFSVTSSQGARPSEWKPESWRWPMWWKPCLPTGPIARL